MRVGWGYDAHRFTETGAIILGGVIVDAERGVAATSDGDVLAHAVIDALLGAAARGDMGTHFPSEDSRWHGADSMAMLPEARGIVEDAGLTVASVDATVLAETVRIAEHRDAIRQRLATVLGLPVDAVSVKATTTDGLGFTGTGEGIAATAVATVAPIRPASR